MENLSLFSTRSSLVGEERSVAYIITALNYGVLDILCAGGEDGEEKERIKASLKAS